MCNRKNRFCGTCKKFVKQKKIPKLALSNGFDFPEIPQPLMVSLKTFNNLREFNSALK
jgi:hypothetical protein